MAAGALICNGEAVPGAWAPDGTFVNRGRCSIAGANIDGDRNFVDYNGDTVNARALGFGDGVPGAGQTGGGAGRTGGGGGGGSGGSSQEASQARESESDDGSSIGAGGIAGVPRSLDRLAMRVPTGLWWMRSVCSVCSKSLQFTPVPSVRANRTERAQR